MELVDDNGAGRDNKAYEVHENSWWNKEIVWLLQLFHMDIAIKRLLVYEEGVGS